VEDNRAYGDQGLSGILFMLAFFIFIVVYSGNAAALKENPDSFPVTHTLIISSGNHFDATVSSASKAADHQILFTVPVSAKGFPNFSLKDKLSDFDHRINTDYIRVCSERLQFEPGILPVVRNQTPMKLGRDIPVLS
jgi:hypothetical protein